MNKYPKVLDKRTRPNGGYGVRSKPKGWLEANKIIIP